MRIRPLRHWGALLCGFVFFFMYVCFYFSHHACGLSVASRPAVHFSTSRPLQDAAPPIGSHWRHEGSLPSPAFVTGDGRMPSPHASRCGMMCHFFQLVPVPPWRRPCRARPIRDASDERRTTTTATTTTMHVVGSVVAIRILSGTAAIGPTQTDLANNAQIIQKETKPAAVPVPFVYRSA